MKRPGGNQVSIYCKPKRGNYTQKTVHCFVCANWAGVLISSTSDNVSIVRHVCSVLKNNNSKHSVFSKTNETRVIKKRITESNKREREGGENKRDTNAAKTQRSKPTTRVTQRALETESCAVTRTNERRTTYPLRANLLFKKKKRDEHYPFFLNIYFHPASTTREKRTEWRELKGGGGSVCVES